MTIAINSVNDSTDVTTLTGQRGRLAGEKEAKICRMYGCSLSDEETLFETSNVKFFEGPPQRDGLTQGQLGVNIDLFRQIKDHYNKAKENIACRVLADICQDIQDNGYIGRMDDSAERLNSTNNTIQRWRSRFADNGLLKRHNLNGRYSVDPKVAIRVGSDGELVKPVTEKKAVFKF